MSSQSPGSRTGGTVVLTEGHKAIFSRAYQRQLASAAKPYLARVKYWYSISLILVLVLTLTPILTLPSPNPNPYHFLFLLIPDFNSMIFDENNVCLNQYKCKNKRNGDRGTSHSLQSAWS